MGDSAATPAGGWGWPTATPNPFRWLHTTPDQLQGSSQANRGGGGLRATLEEARVTRNSPHANNGERHPRHPLWCPLGHPRSNIGDVSKVAPPPWAAREPSYMWLEVARGHLHGLGVAHHHPQPRGGCRATRLLPFLFFFFLIKNFQLFQFLISLNFQFYSNSFLKFCLLFFRNSFFY